MRSRGIPHEIKNRPIRHNVGGTYLTGYTPAMTLDSLIILSGALVAILPFLGFPNTWDSVIFLILGALVVTLGIVVRRRAPRRTAQDRDSFFVENTPHKDR